jgi:hypothetical protein
VRPDLANNKLEVIDGKENWGYWEDLANLSTIIAYLLKFEDQCQQLVDQTNKLTNY